MTAGNAIDLRKEADTLDKYRDALLAIYRTKFDASDETIKAMLDSETWIIGESASFFMLDAEVIPTEEPLRAAAFAKQMPKFLNTPKALKEIIMEKEQETKQANDELKEEVVETKADETTAEPVVEEPKEEAKEETVEEPKAEEPKEEMVAKAEADKRVSGMQSAMAKQMDALKKDYEAKISEFETQIRAKDEELAKVRADATSLAEKLETFSKELSNMTSALEEKTNALAILNASVNTPKETTDWKSLKGKDFFDWYRRNH